MCVVGSISAAIRVFSCNSIFGHYRQSIWNMLAWLMSVSYCSVVVWPAVAGSTKCVLMFLCVTWHRHWYIWLLYVADGYVAYCSVAVWPAVAGSTKCVLMFLCVTWHRHWYIWLLYVADGYIGHSTVMYLMFISCSSQITLGISRQ